MVTGEASEADNSEEGERQFELPKQLKQHYLEVSAFAWPDTLSASICHKMGLVIHTPNTMMPAAEL